MSDTPFEDFGRSLDLLAFPLIDRAFHGPPELRGDAKNSLLVLARESVRFAVNVARVVAPGIPHSAVVMMARDRMDATIDWIGPEDGFSDAEVAELRLIAGRGFEEFLRCGPDEVSGQGSVEPENHSSLGIATVPDEYLPSSFGGPPDSELLTPEQLFAGMVESVRMLVSTFDGLGLPNSTLRQLHLAFIRKSIENGDEENGCINEEARQNSIRMSEEALDLVLGPEPG